MFVITMTFGETFPQRLLRIDELTRSDHSYLDEDDVCFFIGEYTARQGFAFSATNNLIINFKKSMDRRSLPEWRYKGEAIRKAATAFRQAILSGVLDAITFVPIPPSKALTDPLYDDRITQMLRAIRPKPALDVRELIVQEFSTDAVHDNEVRPTPDEIVARYKLEETLLQPEPGFIAVVDDVLTTGSHYRAAHTLLRTRFPTTPIQGLFLARRAPQTSDLEEFI